MVPFIRTACAKVVDNYWLDGFELPADFQMLTTEEIEHDLELDKPGWQDLLSSSEGEPKPDGEPKPANPGWFSRVAILVAVVALSAVFWGEASTAAGPGPGGAHMQLKVRSGLI